MQRNNPRSSRRDFLLSIGALPLALSPVSRAAAGSAPMLKKPIPGSGEQLPVIGMGSWLTFDVGTDAGRRDDRVRVLRTFFETGGAVVDSSPMYGSSEEVIGYCLARLPDHRSLFSATKVWTWLQSRGVDQMQESKRQIGRAHV